MAAHCVSIKGLDAIMKQLDRLGANLPEIVDKSLQSSAEFLTGKVKEKITEFGAVDTGAMRNDTAWKKKGLCSYVVTCPKKYAIFVEFGTGSLGDPAVAHNTSDLTTYTRNGQAVVAPFKPHPPRPFMRTAFAENKDKIKQKLQYDILVEAKGKLTNG